MDQPHLHLSDVLSCKPRQIWHAAPPFQGQCEAHCILFEV